jgi:putative peptidoglycan lipid II flippase
VTGNRRSKIFGASVVSALGTGLSRVLGAARDVTIGHIFGAGRASDAFWMAWTIPSLFRRFVADEGLTGALIPAVARAEQEVDTREARRLANGALLALLVAGAAICVVGILGAPLLVRLIAPGFSDDPEKLALTISLTRWLFPFVVFVSLVSYCEGLLNYRGHFFVPKLAPGIVRSASHR